MKVEGGTWTIKGGDLSFKLPTGNVVMRGPLPPEVAARIPAKRDAAWARRVKATIEEREAAAVGIADRERGASGTTTDRERAELDAAKQALRDLGVNVDALLDGRGS